MQQIAWRREQIGKREVGKIRLSLSAKQPQLSVLHDQHSTFDDYEQSF